MTGVSLGHRELSEADHWILSLSPRPVLACTHLVRTPFPHVAISLNAAAAPSAPAAEVDAAGRAVIFPGWEALTGELSVADMLSVSAIDRVEVLGGGPASPSAVVNTGDFVRPQFRDGSLVLVTTPAVGGRLVPFESRFPTPCCAAHLH